MMRMLKSGGYHNLIGFDFAPNMIKRGWLENPDLDLRSLPYGVLSQVFI